MMDTQKKISDRLKLARKSRRLTQTELAAGLGIKYQNIGRWENGDVTPGAKHLPRLAEALGVRVEWLLTGEGEMLIRREGGAYVVTDQEPSTVKEASVEVRRIPVIGEVSAGKATIYWKAPPDHTVVGARVSEEAFALRIVDDSMEPKYSERDVVVVDPLAEVKNGDTAIVEHGGEMTFKKVLFEGECILCQPLNKKQDAFSIRCTERTRLVGRVMAKVTVY